MKFSRVRKRFPYFKDQQDPVFAGVIPRLVFNRVIKEPYLARNPFPDVITNAKAAASRNDEREMTNQARIDHAVVRRNSGARLEPGKQDVRTALA